MCMRSMAYIREAVGIELSCVCTHSIITMSVQTRVQSNTKIGFHQSQVPVLYKITLAALPVSICELEDFYCA